MLTATSVSAQEPTPSAETAPVAASQPAAEPTAATQPDAPAAENADLDADLESLFAAPAAEAAPETSPEAAPETAASTPVAPPQADNASAAPATAELPADTAVVSTAASPATPPTAAAKEADPTYELIPVPLKDNQSEAVTQAVREAPTHLEEIVVTATKRPQLVREIPASIAVLTGDKLEEMGAHELKDFIQSVPGINTQDEIAGIQRKLSVRGVGPDTGTNQTVGIVYGDVPLSDPYGSYTIADPDPWDLSTVEVLKGPQGTLFGATSLAGLIRYVPNNPELGRWGGRVSADWVHVTDGGTEPSFGGVLNIPIGETAAVRFAGTWQHKPGLLDIENPSYNKVDADDGYTRTGRVMALWKPTEELALNLWYVKGQRSADELGYITNDQGIFVRDDAAAPSLVRNGYSLANLDVRYNFDWATLVSITGYQTKNSFNDADTSYLVLPLAQLGVRSLHATRDVKTSGYLQELRLVSTGDGPWNWMGGVFYSTYKADMDTILYAYPAFPGIAALLNLVPPELLSGLYTPNGIIATKAGFHPVKASEKAVFGEVSRKIGDDLTITLGARVYEAGVSGTVVKTGLLSVVGGINGEDASSQTLESIGKGFSPKVAATWHFTEDIMFYGTVSRGFQYGGFNVGTLGTVPPKFKSSTLWNHELGIRTDWMDSTFRFDFTALYVVWKNPQVNQVKNETTGYTDNVGGARNIGGETTISYLTPIPGLKLESAASYIVSETTKPFTDTSGVVVQPGTALPSSPKLQASNSISYSFGVGEWQTQTTLQHTYQGKAFNNIVHDVEVGGYNLLNLNFAVSRADLSFVPSISFSINNLTGTSAATSALGGSGTVPGSPELSEIVTPRPYVFTQPRSFRLNLSAKF